MVHAPLGGVYVGCTCGHSRCVSSHGFGRSSNPVWGPGSDGSYHRSWERAVLSARDVHSDFMMPARHAVTAPIVPEHPVGRNSDQFFGAQCIRLMAVGDEGDDE